MLSDDLKAAVESGILSSEQAAKLSAFLDARAQAAEPAAVSSEDERFRLFKGFNDVFLATGVALALAACLTRVVGYLPDHQQLGSTYALLAACLISAALAWGFAELLVARHRALLPGIVACSGFALFLGILLGSYLPTMFGLARPTGMDGDWVIWQYATWAGGFFGSLLAALAFYVRFRFPFALLIAGGSLVLGVYNGATWFLGQGGGLFAVGLLLACGLSLFALAMRFDASDTARETRRSDCGFWLHLAAAPAIVYPVLILTAGFSVWTNEPHTANPVVVFPVIALLALVALIVDRRALLVSSLLSLGVAIGYLIKTAAITADAAITVTLAILGTFVVAMGLAWHPLRALVLKPFSGSPLLNYIPPVKP